MRSARLRLRLTLPRPRTSRGARSILTPLSNAFGSPAAAPHPATAPDIPERPLNPDPSFKCVRLACGCASQSYPAMIFFISVSAQAMESLVEVPVTALAIMLGRMYELVMSCTLSDAGAGQP